MKLMVILAAPAIAFVLLANQPAAASIADSGKLATPSVLPSTLGDDAVLIKHGGRGHGSRGHSYGHKNRHFDHRPFFFHHGFSHRPFYSPYYNQRCFSVYDSYGRVFIRCR